MSRIEEVRRIHRESRKAIYAYARDESMSLVERRENIKREEDGFYEQIHLLFEAEITALRRLLWLKHGCPQSALYGDDGEMQCNQCGVDFKRLSVQDI